MSSDDKPTRTAPWEFGLISTAEIGDLEIEYVTRALRKRRVFRYSPGGVDQSEAFQLEVLYGKRLGLQHCLAVNSGTSALISALVGAQVGPGDEVIVPGYTYIATAAAVLIAGAVPVIVEVDDTLTMDPRAFEEAITVHTRAVIPVHMRGVPCQMDDIVAIAQRHHLLVIEDVAQANGGSYHGRPLGSIGNVGCFSFQQHKLVTAGEGGMVATDDDLVYERASVYHDSAFVYWGQNREKNYTLFPGENYRMSELNAALVLAQSQRMDSLLSRLREVKTTIVKGIQDIDEIQLQRIPDPAGDVSWSLVFYLPTVAQAKTFAERLRAEGIPAGTIDNEGFPDRHIYKNWDYVLAKRGVSETDTPWTCESYRGDVRYSPDMCPRTLNWLGRAIGLQLHQNMDPDDCSDLVEAIRKVASKIA